MQIKEILKGGVEFLADSRSNALLDCELVLANVLGVEKEYLIAHSDEEIGKDLADLFVLYLKRLQEGESVAYILKEKEFYGLNFYVDKRVLVPRPETEMLVEKVLEYLRTNEEEDTIFKVLDVGTGSGNIAISLAVNFENVELTAVDISEEAVAVAKLNVEQHCMEDNVDVFQSDLLEVVDDGEKYDVIVANLPYIGVVTNNGVDANVLNFEPGTALFAGSDGLDLYRKMFQQILDKEISFEMMVGEFGSMQTKDMEKLLDEFFEGRWEIYQDLEGRDRMFVVNIN